MKTNGTFQPTPAPGKPTLPPVPALIDGAFAITAYKQTKGTWYELNHIPTGARMFGNSDFGALKAGRDAIAGLIDWGSITDIGQFDALPVETRQRIATTWTDWVNVIYPAQERERKTDRAKRADEDRARFIAGVPFDQAPPSKTYHYGVVDGKHGALYVGEVDGETWITDGYLAHVGTVPDGETVKPAPIQQVIPTRFDHEARPVAYFQTVHKNPSRLVVLDDGTLLNYDMHRFLMRKFKGATIQVNTILSPVGYVVNGKTVAIQMPVTVTTPIPDAVVQIVQQAACVTA